jgi:polyisoprenoid-binding protein YceI
MTMKHSKNIALLNTLLVCALAGAVTLQAEMTRYGARHGSKVKIDGTSTIHDWTVEGNLIAGYMEFDSKVKIGEDSPEATAGKIEATASASIQVNSLKSGKELMDNIMYDAMKKDANPRILFVLKELVLKDKPAAGAPVTFDSKGDLTVAGVKKEIAMPVKMEKTADGLVKVTGEVSVKMTEFGITPPAPKIAMGMIKTGDDVKLSIEWMTKPLPK